MVWLVIFIITLFFGTFLYLCYRQQEDMEKSLQRQFDDERIRFMTKLASLEQKVNEEVAEKLEMINQNCASAICDIHADICSMKKNLKKNSIPESHPKSAPRKK